MNVIFEHLVLLLLRQNTGFMSIAGLAGSAQLFDQLRNTFDKSSKTESHGVEGASSRTSPSSRCSNSLRLIHVI